MSETSGLQNVSNLASNKPRTKVCTRILITRIKAKIRKVIMNTRDQLVEKHKDVQNSKQKIVSKLQDIQYSQRQLCSDESCNRCHDLQTRKDKKKAQRLQQRIDVCSKKSQQIKNNHDELNKIYTDFCQNGFKQFYVVQQANSSDFVEIKKQVLEVYDLYERGRLKLNKLNQIYTQFHDLSLLPCGICFVQPKIEKIVILKFGHSLCQDCFFSLMNCQTIRNQLMKCPFCRQQIEFIVNKQIENQ
ncbi:DNA helicase rad5 [Paramecium bursaria]